jgi:hypothetical protein
MRPVFFLTVLCLFAAPALFAHDGDDHGANSASQSATGATHFSINASSNLFEVVLRYRPIQPGENAHLQLFLSDFATNAPIRGAKLTLTAQENPKLQFAVVERSPGEYVVDANFDKMQPYTLTLNIVAGTRADLLLLKSVEVGKVLTPATAPEAQSWWSWQLLILLIGVFLAGMAGAWLIMRLRNSNSLSHTSIR